MGDVRAACGTLGRRVAWEDKEGRAVDVTDDGALVVEGDDGARVEVRVGDVRLRQLR
jgi:biotin-(acetyl-CoA carboxylase) ligase